MGVDLILKIAGVGLLTAVVAIVLKKSASDEIATFATLAGLIIVLLLVMDMVGGLFDTIKSIFSLSNSSRLGIDTSFVSGGL